jgi:hypothetical protein
MNDRNLTNSQSPRASRASTQDPLEHAKGQVQIEQNPIRKDGGPENADASKVKSDRSIESVNKRADPV